MKAARPKSKTGQPSKFAPESAEVVLAYVRRGWPPEQDEVLEEQVNERVADLFHLTPDERRLIASG